MLEEASIVLAQGKSELRIPPSDPQPNLRPVLACLDVPVKVDVPLCRAEHPILISHLFCFEEGQRPLRGSAAANQNQGYWMVRGRAHDDDVRCPSVLLQAVFSCLDRRLDARLDAPQELASGIADTLEHGASSQAVSQGTRMPCAVCVCVCV